MGPVTAGARQIPFHPRRWTRLEYERLVELGAFHGEPLELIDGRLVVAEPQHAYHASAITRVDYAIRAILPPGWIVRLQSPVALDDDSEPEPDLAVVPGHPFDYDHGHPSRVALAVEVADASLAFDRDEKASAYARAGVPDYWIVNLMDRVLEVHREPVADPHAALGWSYASVTALAPPDAVVPLAFPGAPLTVADLLPRRPA